MENIILSEEQLRNQLAANEEYVSSQGASGQPANLERVDLRGVNLSFANLTGANLNGACLVNVDLRGAVLNGATLIGADLTGAQMSCCDMQMVNLASANMTRVDARSSNLKQAILSNANLTDADFRHANLDFAALNGATLSGTGLLLFQFEQHPAYYKPDGTLSIGGVTKSLAQWQLEFAGIAQANGYTPTQTTKYLQFIEMCVDPDARERIKLEEEAKALAALQQHLEKTQPATPLTNDEVKTEGAE